MFNFKVIFVIISLAIGLKVLAKHLEVQALQKHGAQIAEENWKRATNQDTNSDNSNEAK